MHFIFAALVAVIFSTPISGRNVEYPEVRYPEDDYSHRCKIILKCTLNENACFYEDTSHQEEVFCEFKNNVIAKLTGDNEQIIQEYFLSKFRSKEITSGRFFLSNRNGNIGSFSKDSTEIRISNTTDFRKDMMIIPDVTSPILEEAMTGSKKVLVLRVITGGGEQVPPSDEGRLSDKWFGTKGDPVNNKSQYLACSNGQTKFNPYAGKTRTGVRITNGVYTITVNADRTQDDLVRTQALAEGRIKLGNLQSQFDYVALSIPNNDKNYAAYAFLNGWLSVYKSSFVDLVTVQMHEIGHNLGLAHSGEGGSDYGDSSGIMGAVFADDRRICFNGPKNAQLGWYSSREVDVTSGYNGELYGIVDYGKTSSKEKMILKLSNGAGTDYYVTFNKAAGANLQTAEGANKVLVHSRVSGNDAATSSLLAKLSAGQSFSGGPKEIKVESINGGKARVVISGETCVDYPEWTDTYGDGCRWYEDNSLEGCQRWRDCCDAGEGTPNQACCWCGGGRQKASLPILDNKPGASTSGSCYEEAEGRYFKRFVAGGKARTATCSSLAKLDYSKMKKWCSKTDEGGGFPAAKDRCKVTCDQCPNGCNEISNTKFSWTKSSCDKVRTRTCTFLKSKKKIWSDKQFNDTCKQSSGQCPITCGMCD